MKNIIHFLEVSKLLIGLYLLNSESKKTFFSNINSVL